MIDENINLFRLSKKQFNKYVAKALNKFLNHSIWIFSHIKQLLLLLDIIMVL